MFGSGIFGSGGSGVVEAAEEERGVGDVLQGFGPVVERGLEVLLGDWVSAHGSQRQHVLPHQPEVLAGTQELVALGGEDGVSATPFVILLVIFFCW
jgi:hypothetical protein